MGGERYPRSVLRFANGGYTRANPRLHPTQKPLSLLQWLIQTYTDAEATVLDPFMGSGSTGVACLKAGRQFLGVELEPSYYAAAQSRLQNLETNVSVIT